MISYLLLLSVLLAPVSASLHLDLLTVTAEELSFHLGIGHISSVHLVEQYLAQIEAHNINGLGLRAVIETAPRRQVLDIAGQLDYERRIGKSRGPLHGIPILVKDNIATHPELGMRTTAGSLALEYSLVQDDAVVIAKLRKAGAIILGKTNMSEWANIRGSFGMIPNGWSARGGQTQSAYVTGPFNSSERDPSGSSTGSAVGVSAGFAPLALGTETDGSIVIAANRAALYGIKATVGAVSAVGVIPVAPKSMDSVGVMAKSTWDLTTGLGAIVNDEGAGSRYLEALQRGILTGWDGLKIGVMDRSVFWDPKTGEYILEASLAAIDKMQSLGAIVSNVTMPSAQKALASHKLWTKRLIVIQAEFKESLDSYLHTLRNTSIHTLQDLIAFNLDFAAAEMPLGHCCQEFFIDALSAHSTNSSTYRSALNVTQSIARDHGIDYALRTYDVDVLVAPTEAPWSSTLAAMAGYPIATVPLGYINESGRPFGLSFFTGADGEEMLIRVLGAWEKEFGRRRVPSALGGQAGVGGVARLK
ncbi:hypothetical protein Q9L58_000811 [Maublancomyces gigas]|uniref:Amidase domain-containing protein n=1 Tax=Discina gigas TaxID=1032678 RepID=A0ABR3GVX2_9PEZI